MSVFKCLCRWFCGIFGIKQQKKSHRRSHAKRVQFKPVPRRLNYLKGNKHRVLLVNNVYARNPTYKELIAFLDKDKTEQIKYRYGKFVCADYAQVLHNHAEKAGYKCAWVSIDFTYGYGHACNAFKTVDKGLIFVDSVGSLDGSPNDDKTVKVHVGREYVPRAIHSYDVTYDAMGIVKKYKVYW